MSEHTPRPANPVPPNPGSVPRSSEEAEVLFEKISKDEAKAIIKRAEAANAKITRAKQIASLFKTPGWTAWWEDILALETDFLRGASVLEIKGGILEKGAFVENLQGGYGILQAIKESARRYEDISKQQPVNVEEFKRILDNQKK